MEVPIGDQVYKIGFWVIFEKGRKKSTKGLYKLRFEIEDDDEDGPTHSNIDQEFLCSGFLHLIKDFALACQNPL